MFLHLHKQIEHVFCLGFALLVYLVEHSLKCLPNLILESTTIFGLVKVTNSSERNVLRVFISSLLNVSGMGSQNMQGNLESKRGNASVKMYWSLIRV